jgi:CBS domain-containing protein
MAAALAGVMRSPLTGVIFAVELTGAWSATLPLLVACVVAHAVTVLALKRSILTEKLARRGFHVTREYAVDPLEVLSVREVMQSSVTSLASDLPLAVLRRQFTTQSTAGTERLLPVLDDSGRLAGVVTRSDLERIAQVAGGDDHQHVGDIMRREVVVAYPDETLRTVAARMITMSIWRMPVVSRANPREVVGLISQRALLRARERLLEEERRREQVFQLRIITPRQKRPSAYTQDIDDTQEVVLQRSTVEDAPVESVGEATVASEVALQRPAVDDVPVEHVERSSQG